MGLGEETFDSDISSFYNPSVAFRGSTKNRVLRSNRGPRGWLEFQKELASWSMTSLQMPKNQLRGQIYLVGAVIEAVRIKKIYTTNLGSHEFMY